MVGDGRGGGGAMNWLGGREEVRFRCFEGEKVLLSLNGFVCIGGEC